MAKEPRTKLSGKEARYIIHQNHISLAWLAEKLGIKPQSLNSRLHSAEFKTAYQIEINNAVGKRIFDVDMNESITEVRGRIPVIDIRVSAGFERPLMEGDEHRVVEYVTMEGLNDCVGVSVYGDSMSPEYRPGDVIFVRRILDISDIDYGRAYIVITRSERVLKCIYQSKHDAQQLRLCSLNEETNKFGDRLFPDREIKKEDVLFIYKVVGMFRREQI
jgi:phage repressor protein C with HTH and peptisase S24 domain